MDNLYPPAAPNTLSQRDISHTLGFRQRGPGMQAQSIVPNRRAQRAIWLPSLSVGFRVLVLLRFCAAMYSNIQDCDEVFNYWEPLHYLQFGTGFQTWETSPKYALRSWAYILLHLPFAKLGTLFGVMHRRRSFFAVRIVLAFVSSFVEATFYRSVGENMNDHIGRYLLFILFFSPGMWISSTALLPSSFSMYLTTLAMAFAMKPASQSGYMRTLSAVVCFAISAVVGWPFALLLAVPFVFEELFVWAGDKVPSVAWSKWVVGRWRRMALCGAIASFVFVPVVFIDTQAYGKLSIVPWNLVQYNIFSPPGRGPELYGTEPWHFYIKNLLLNFNVVLPLALFSYPALLITHTFDYRRLGFIKHGKEETSPYTLLAIRLAPVYLWLGVLSMQPHKEERFMYPIYPLLCFNGATTLFLIRGWVETMYARSVSIYAASQTKLMKRMTFLVIATYVVLSCARIGALFEYYRAPLGVAYHFEHVELPRLLNATSLLPPLPEKPAHNSAYEAEDLDTRETPQLGLRVCYGKEWYRFPGQYHFVDGIEVRFVKSAFAGHLPQKFKESENGVPAKGLWWREQTRIIPEGLNDMNREEHSVYVDINSCDYLIDLDFPLHFTSASPSSLEPRHAIDDETYERMFCLPFLDAAHSPLLTRTLYTGIPALQAKNAFGDYCLLRNRKRGDALESRKWERKWTL